VDQHPLWLEAVEPVVSKIGVDVVGKATSPSRALELISELRPDILVTELRTPEGEMDGVSLLRQARERQPEVRSIVLSMYDDPQHIDAALAAGAIAYVIKTAHPDDIASAIRQGFEHSLFLANGPRPTAVAAEARPTDTRAFDLTRRELEILQLMAEGLSNAELARRLWVTEQTVKFHLSNVYRKLDVSNRTEASRWAQLNGLLPARPSAAAVDAA
jgi:DNA-binding NarL/FixJ family response regulator